MNSIDGECALNIVHCYIGRPFPQSRFVCLSITKQGKTYFIPSLNRMFMVAVVAHLCLLMLSGL